MKGIDSIANTEKKPGYKKTRLGWIPVEWEVINLEKIGFFFKGKGISKSEVLESGLPCIRYGEIYTDHNIIIKEFRSFISEESAKASRKIIKNDLLFAGSGETLEDIGKVVAYLDDKIAYAGGDIVIFRPHNVNSEFLVYSLNHPYFLRQKRKIGQGHSVVHIYSKDLGKLMVTLPPLPEQRKIATILSTWDRAIDLTRQLIEQKQQLKKGLMQQLLTGRKRFPGFKGEWKEVLLEKIFTFKKGKGLSKGIICEDGQNKCVLYGELYTRYSEVIDTVHSRTEIDDGTPSVNGDILIPCSTTTSAIDLANATAILEDGVLIGGDINILRPISQISSRFMAQLLTHIKKKDIASRAQGITIIHLYGSDLKGIKVKIPQDAEEQQKIASVLSACDREIQWLNRYLTALESQKKGLMQKLLTGEVRVNV